MGPRSQFEWTMVHLSASDSGSAEHLLWARHVLGPGDIPVNSRGPHFHAAYGLGKVTDKEREPRTPGSVLRGHLEGPRAQERPSRDVTSFSFYPSQHQGLFIYSTLIPKRI